MKRALLVLAALASLAACGYDGPPRHCVSEHTEIMPIQIYSGSVNNVPIFTTMWLPTEVCDRYELDQP